jgi:multiple sugar transport system substrate-binding protein
MKHIAIGKWGLAMGAVLLVLQLLAGCGGQAAEQAGGASGNDGKAAGKEAGQQAGKPVEPNFGTDPVTISVLTADTDMDIQAMLIDPVSKKYPFITLNILKRGKGNSIPELIAAGELPDLIANWTGGLTSQIQYGIFFDISPLIKSHNVDLSRFQPNALDSMRKATDNQLFGLPFNMQFFAMFYNKDIFDKFGAPYPKDGMTWESAIELARKVTREDGGVQYRGLDPDGIERMGLSLSLESIDGKNDQPTVNNDQWKRVFELGKQLYSIPGNGLTKAPFDDFVKDRRLAMLASYNRFSQMEEPSSSGMNWDVVQYPSFNEKPNTFGLSNPWFMMITSTSKHKDQAMQVIEVLTSDEVQLINSRKAVKLPPLNNPEMQKQFGADLPFMKGKNIAGVFKSHAAPAPVGYSEFHSKADSLMKKNFNDYEAGTIDVNTALRQSDEAIAQMVKDSK